MENEIREALRLGVQYIACDNLRVASRLMLSGVVGGGVGSSFCYVDEGGSSSSTSTTTKMEEIDFKCD